MGNPRGVPLYSSPDIKTWKLAGTIVPHIEGNWYQKNFWAPEIHAKDTPAGRNFYCTFNGFNVNTKKGGVGLAVAERITGPYTVLTPDAPNEVGYATAKDLHGPWTKGSDNPIYGARSETMCKRYHKAYTQEADVPYVEVGHGQPFIGPDGKWWISAHFGQTQRPPEAAGFHGWEQPGYDPLVFENGAFKRVQPSWTPQWITLPP